MEAKSAGSYLTFGELSEEWLFAIEGTKKYSTYVKYRGICRKHLKILEETGIEEISNVLLNEKIFQNRETARYTQNLKHTVIQVVNQIIRFGNEVHGYRILTLANKGSMEKRKRIEIINHTEQTALLRCLSVSADR